MKKLKINLDRPPLESKYIESKQNFDHVLNGFKQLKPPIWKNPWFYGPVGVASLALVLSIGLINAKNDIHDNTSTLTASNELPEDTKCIHAPISTTDHEFKSFNIDPAKDQTITLPSGTTIDIPKGSLMPSSMDQDVEIKVREFRDKSSAFIGGISMDYKEDAAFESAGMIEVRGQQDGKEVSFSPNKKIEVSLVLTKNPKDFDFWKLNEGEKEWEKYPVSYKTESTDQSSHSAEQLKSLEHEIVVTKNKIVTNELASKANVTPSKIDYNLPISQNQRFDLDFDTKEFPELEKFQGMEFEVASKKAYDRSFTKKTWSSVDLTKESETYYATFFSKNEKFKIAVRPVLTGQKREQAEAAFSKSMDFYEKKKVELELEKEVLLKEQKRQQERYNSLIESFQQDKAKQQQEEAVANVKVNNAQAVVSEFTATFSTNTFGVFNCDKPITYPEAFSSEIAFSYNGSDVSEILTAYVFDEKKDTRFTFGDSGTHTLQDLGCFEKNKNTLVVVDKNGHLGYVLDFNSEAIRNGVIKLIGVDKMDVNVDFIQKLINEKPASS